MTFDVTNPEVRRAVELALEEDVRTGDITTEATVPADLQGEARFVARQEMTLAGVELLELVFNARVGPVANRPQDAIVPHVVAHSGARLQSGDVIATVCGPARLLLTRERVALNFMQRLSGIATLAAKYVAEVEGTGVKILDTRKTTPGLRVLEKMAAAAGGVQNHRMGLWDAVLIKNNHISIAGSVRAACERAMECAKPLGIAVEVEVRTRAEIEEALACGAKRLLLDNMTPAQAAEEIRFINKRATVELSGGMTLANVRAYAEAGPDYISAGAITHSATAVDINCGIHVV